MTIESTLREALTGQAEFIDLGQLATVDELADSARRRTRGTQVLMGAGALVVAFLVVLGVNGVRGAEETGLVVADEGAQTSGSNSLLVATGDDDAPLAIFDLETETFTPLPNQIEVEDSTKGIHALGGPGGDYALIISDVEVHKWTRSTGELELLMDNHDRTSSSGLLNPNVMLVSNDDGGMIINLQNGESTTVDAAVGTNLVSASREGTVALVDHQEGIVAGGELTAVDLETGTTRILDQSWLFQNRSLSPDGSLAFGFKQAGSDSRFAVVVDPFNDADWLLNIPAEAGMLDLGWVGSTLVTVHDDGSVWTYDGDTYTETALLPGPPPVGAAVHTGLTGDYALIAARDTGGVSWWFRLDVNNGGLVPLPELKNFIRRSRPHLPVDHLFLTYPKDVLRFRTGHIMRVPFEPGDSTDVVLLQQPVLRWFEPVGAGSVLVSDLEVTTAYHGNGDVWAEFEGDTQVLVSPDDSLVVNTFSVDGIAVIFDSDGREIATLAEGVRPLAWGADS